MFEWALSEKSIALRYKKYYGSKKEAKICHELVKTFVEQQP